jgi:predicted nucleotidyltransferase
MYRIHRNVQSKLSKLRSILKRERAHLTSVRNLYNDGRFEFIEQNLNDVTKEFINSELRNVQRKPCGRKWTMQDKAFALSIYKRSPRLFSVTVSQKLKNAE